MEPGPSTLSAFGVSGRCEPLAGGYETSVVVDGVVLKRVQDLDVAHLVQAVLAEALAERAFEGVAVPEPLRTVGGDWSSEGWTATRFVAGLQPARHDHHLLLDASAAFTRGLSPAAGSPATGSPAIDTSAIRRRTDRWARADRYAWGEIELTMSPQAEAVAATLWLQTTDTEEPTGLVHADLAGNTFVDAGDMPVVLDFSPVIRPARFQTGIVVGDSLLWGEGDSSLATATDADSLARALLFRLAAAELAPRPGNADLDHCRRVAVALDWR